VRYRQRHTSPATRCFPALGLPPPGGARCEEKRSPLELLQIGAREVSVPSKSDQVFEGVLP
jgi:hypothetical protein